MIMTERGVNDYIGKTKMTESDVNNYIYTVKIVVAQKLGTQVDALETAPPEVNKLLDGFIENYKNWHNFHVKHHNDAGCLSLEEEQELISLMENRDKSRNDLIELIKLEEKEVQLEAQMFKEQEMDRNLKEKSQENRKRRLQK